MTTELFEKTDIYTQSELSDLLDITREGEPKMPKFRKKPVVIEAVQWKGWNLLEVIRHTGQHASATDYKWEDYEDLVRREGLKIFTLEGTMKADISDWIIKGIQGECYPCKPDIFEATYEAVN